MAELPDVSGGEIIAAGYTSDVKNRTLMRYASAAARDSSIPSPVEGDFAYLVATSEVTVYTGASWVSVYGTFTGVNRGTALNDHVVTTTGVWEDWGSITLNLGTVPGGVNVWVTAQVAGSVLIDASGTDSVYQVRVGVAADGVSYTYSDPVWGSAPVDVRRQNVGASGFLDVTPTGTIRVKVQVLWSSGNQPTFGEGTLTGVMLNTLPT